MTATKIAEYTVVIHCEPGQAFPWRWEIEGHCDGMASTRWGARWGARRACKKLLLPEERWTFTREVS